MKSGYFLIEVERMKKRTKILIAGIVVGTIVVAAAMIKQHLSVNHDGESISIIGGSDGPTSIFFFCK